MGVMLLYFYVPSRQQSTFDLRSTLTCRRTAADTHALPERPRLHCSVALSCQWALSQVAVLVEPDLVKITPHYEPSEAAVWFQVSALEALGAFDDGEP